MPSRVAIIRVAGSSSAVAPGFRRAASWRAALRLKLWMKEAPSKPIMKAGSRVSSKTESPVRLAKSATRSETSLCSTGLRNHPSRTTKAPAAKIRVAPAAAHLAPAAHGLLLAATMWVPGRGPSHNSRSVRISVALAYRLSLSISRQRTTIDKDKRYASATEILTDLELWLGPRPGTRIVAANKRPWAAGAKWAAGGAAVLLATGAFLFREGWFRKPVLHKEVSLLVGDFTNHTGDSVFDETLEPAFIIGLEGASFIQSFNRSAARQEAARLKPGATALDESATRMIATREGIDVI